MKKQSILYLALLLSTLTNCTQKETTTVSATPAAQQKAIAFPGAEGAGMYTTGGRGGKVYIVSNLNDSGPGSLREAIEQQGPRTIVFAVSGNIDLKSRLSINTGDVTMAGQSAPGDGICIKGYPVTVAADNVIIRYLRFRMGNEHDQEADALSGRQHKNIIIDHCSMSWSVDECASFYTNEDFTMQWCIISESLNSSLHAKGKHGYGGIWGGTRVSFHHNLLAHHNSRNPRFSGSKYETDVPSRQLDFRNNVIYNWGMNSAYGGEEGEHNMVNNYYKPGPATPKTVQSRIVNPSKPYGKFYVAGNYVAGNEKVSQDNWAGGVQCDDPEVTRSNSVFAYAPVATQSAEEAYKLVLTSAGASLTRDAVDERVVEEVRSGTATFKGSVSGRPGIIDSQEDVGGWPELNSKPAPEDADKDGMPDSWEMQHNLNPGSPTDAVAHTLHGQYTNLEMYLNSLVEPQKAQ
ncbi:pectate lyase [Pontibacter korlensis]|uniref:Pectate lyase n=1 Tax=Pontibacter korlensis TaxID=400092 RepID=A0A0E3UXP0_9BACT|nr:pectate lyase [Pontibacter korlensis]AKD03746.1 pectate lyase [Pontibacter korlensis]